MAPSLSFMYMFQTTTTWSMQWINMQRQKMQRSKVQSACLGQLKRGDDVNCITLDLHLWAAIRLISCCNWNLEDKKPLEDNLAEEPHPQADIRIFSESVYIGDCIYGCFFAIQNSSIERTLRSGKQDSADVGRKWKWNEPILMYIHSQQDVIMQKNAMKGPKQPTSVF